MLAFRVLLIHALLLVRVVSLEPAPPRQKRIVLEPEVHGRDQIQSVLRILVLPHRQEHVVTAQPVQSKLNLIVLVVVVLGKEREPFVPRLTLAPLNQQEHVVLVRLVQSLPLLVVLALG